MTEPPRVAAYAGERDAWDAFVRTTPGGTLFHRIAWKEVIERLTGFRSHYLTAWRGGAIAGVLPLFELRAPLLPRQLLSVPLAIEGGVCCADSAVQVALDAAARALAAARGARAVELRDGRIGIDFVERGARYARFERLLLDSEAATFAALPAKRRNMIRRGQRLGLEARVDAGDLDAFHDLYARTTRRFGTPVLPRRFFRDLLAAFPHETLLLTVRHGAMPVASALALRDGDRMGPYYVGGRREAFHLGVNDFLYWELMRHAGALGARRFDFGRSQQGTGAFTFKRLWGATPEPLRYRVHVPGGGPPPDRSSRNTGLRWAQAAWRRLPLPLTKLLGPRFVRYAPYFT